MPWEKSFDEGEVVGKAMKVFWEKGFEPSSMADLIAGTGIARGSLYNAFGGKRQLFIKALEKYDRENRRVILADMEALDDPTRAIAMLFDCIVSETVADTDKKGCFLVNTALELAMHDDEVKRIVERGMGEFEAFFRRCIEVAQARGQVPGSVDPATTAKGLVAMIVAIRLLGRGVYDASTLKAIAAQAQRLLH
ncbi:MAG: TetR/AcrR family transcriptional regulator [Rhodanobacter sp.]|nr:MAG: TetR/AcrR family transcriptional regulator [Rhodanobacter sp.]